MFVNYKDFKQNKKNDLIVCPSILSVDFWKLNEEVQKVSEETDWIHIDVMDGMFVPNISFGIPIIKSIRKNTELVLDVHLMINDPGRYIKEFADAGADLIVVHVESTNHLHRVIENIRSYDKKAGVALNPATPISQIKEILPFVDLVLLMSVNPGFGGQKYIETTTEKIIELKRIIDENQYNCHIQVDGGISTSNIKEVVQAGANAVVVGSYAFDHENPAKAIKELRECLQ